MSAIINADNGTVTGWRQTLPDGKWKDFSADDVIHFHIDRQEGFLFGTPILVPVIDDIRALRKIEENVELLIYQHIFPLYHYKVGTETAPAGLTETGEREIDVVRNELRYMPAEGSIVTPERHDINAIGAEGRALRAESYLEYFKKRVIAGLGISSIDLGDGSTSNRSTSSTLSRALIDGVKHIQDSLEDQFYQYVLSELLLESTFPIDVLEEKNIVWLRFEEIDIESKIKQEEHAKDLFKASGITLSEFRETLGRDPISIPEQGEDQDPSKYPEWAQTHWKLIDEPTLLIRVMKAGVAGNPAGETLAEAPGSSTTNKQLNKAKQEIAQQKKEEQKSKQVATTLKDGLVEETYQSLKADIVSFISQEGELERSVDKTIIAALIRNWEEYVLKDISPLLSSIFVNGFNQETGNEGYKSPQVLSSGRRTLRAETEKYIRRISDALINRTNKTENSNVSTIFDTLTYRVKMVEDTLSKKAFNFGRLKGAMAKIKSGKLSYIPLDTSCAFCRNIAQNILDSEAITIDDLPPHHGSCMCQFVLTETKD
jgi:hypothetical protein